MSNITPLNKRSCEGCPDVGNHQAALARIQPKVEAPSFNGARKMEDGSILYAKTAQAWEPPPVPEGYERDPQNPWRFTSLWPACVKRLQTPFVKQCGAVKILTICNCAGCPLRRQEVTLDQCQGCEHRKE